MNFPFSLPHFMALIAAGPGSSWTNKIFHWMSWFHVVTCLQWMVWWCLYLLAVATRAGTRLANLRVGQLLEIGWRWAWGNFWLNDNIYVTSGNGAKISRISHPNGPILVDQLRESQAKWVLRVGKPGRYSGSKEKLKSKRKPCPSIEWIFHCCLQFHLGAWLYFSLWIIRYHCFCNGFNTDTLNQNRSCSLVEMLLDRQLLNA